MIYAYTGKTGSGKTFNMVKDAYKNWKRGSDIYSNTVLQFEQHVSERKRKKCGNITYFEEIVELLEVKNGIILIDEAQVLFNARNWEQLPYEFQYKLQQHRKHRLDLYCTTQNMGTIDITYRRLVQEWIHCRDIWALFGVRNPSWFTIHSSEFKDVDQLYNTVDDLIVDTVSKKYFTINPLKKRLYDTMYDIGFRRFKNVWISEYDPLQKKIKQKNYLIPKQLTIKQALQEIKTMEMTLKSKSELKGRY